MKVALIGAGSQSARALVEFLRTRAPDVDCLEFVRTRTLEKPSGALVVGDYEEITADMLRGCEAAINFVGTPQAPSEAELHRINAALPLRLATEAQAAGLGHFIQLSSLSPFGRAQLIGGETPFAPVSGYGRSKAAAERDLAPLDTAAFRVTLLRIPIVYGREAPSKLARLAKLLGRLPVFPVPAVPPRRSVISLENLSRVLLDLLRHPAGGAVFAADPEPFQLGSFARLLPSPPRVLTLPMTLFAPLRALAPSLHHSLFESMEIDPGSLYRPRQPLVPTEEGLRAAFGREMAGR